MGNCEGVCNQEGLKSISKKITIIIFIIFLEHKSEIHKMTHRKED